MKIEGTKSTVQEVHNTKRIEEIIGEQEITWDF